MLCHFQLTQIDCTPRYSVSAWKINKYGENPAQLPTFPSDPSRSEADHAPVMCVPRLRQAGGAETPFKLGLFNPNSSNSPFMHSKTPSGPILPPAIRCWRGWYLASELRIPRPRVPRLLVPKTGRMFYRA